MKARAWALLAVGAPTVGGCLCYGSCPGPETIAWDGRLVDGSRWDGGGGFLPNAECLALCADAGVQEGYFCQSTSPGTLDCQTVCKGGRAPPGLMSLSALGDSLGSVLASAAEFEGAAVHAFWQLADELEVHGLRGDDARAAAWDEVRHAKATAKLALSLGHLPATPRVARPLEARSLEAIALDNAFEGCGRELLGAAVNAHQAEHATDARVRALMRDITPDEQSHARFSFELARTLMPRLPLASRRRVREAQERALATLGTERVGEGVRQRLGWPDGDETQKLVRALRETSLL